MPIKVTNITQQPSYNKTTIVLTSIGAAGGIWYGIRSKKPPLGVTGIALGFAFVGLITGVVFAQLNTSKNKEQVGVY